MCQYVTCINEEVVCFIAEYVKCINEEVICFIADLLYVLMKKLYIAILVSICYMY